MNRIVSALNNMEMADDSYDWDSEGWVSNESYVSLGDDNFNPEGPGNLSTENTVQTKPFKYLQNKRGRESMQGKYLDDTLEEEDDLFKISEPSSKYSGPWPTRDRHLQVRDFGASCPSLGFAFFPEKIDDAAFAEPSPVEVETNTVRRRSIAPRIVSPPGPVGSSTKKTRRHKVFRDGGASCPSFDFNYFEDEKGENSPPKHSPLDSEFEYAKSRSIAQRSIAPASVGATKKMVSPKFQRRKSNDGSPHTPVRCVYSPTTVKLNANVSSEAQNNREVPLHKTDFFSESSISLDMGDGATNHHSNDPPARSIDVDAPVSPLSIRWTAPLKSPQSAPATTKRRFSSRSRGSEDAPLPPAFAAIESMGKSWTKLTGGHRKSGISRSLSMIVTKDEAAAAHNQMPMSEPAWSLRVRQQNISKDSRRNSIDSSDHTTETQSVSDESFSLPLAFQGLSRPPSARKVRVPSVIGHDRPPAFTPAFFEPRIQKQQQEESTSAKLTWTRELKDNFSDWSITIRHSKKRGTKTFTRVDQYYVHRNIVGAGNHASKYFYELFKKGKPSGSNADIELSGSAAAAFPVLLDFIYGINGGEGVEVCTENVVPLRYLGNYFGVSSLFNEVNNFIQNDINRNNVHLYLKDAQEYNDEDLVQATLRIAIQFMSGLLMNQGGRGDVSPFMDLLNESQKQEVLELARGSDGSDSFKCERNMRSPLYQ
jgi:hypothetical protein